MRIGCEKDKNRVIVVMTQRRGGKTLKSRGFTVYDADLREVLIIVKSALIDACKNNS